MESNFKVAVCLVTYNQEKYISQAIDSILKQKTNFPVTIFVGDDCSKDKTPCVLEKYQLQYPGRFCVLRTGKNVGVVENTYNVFKEIFLNSDYRYVAMLDGDDWWCDENKLQKQVDFMEANSDYAFVFTRIAVYNEKNKRYTHSKSSTLKSGNLFHTLMHLGIPNCTVLHRVEFLKRVDWQEILSLNLLSCDYATNVCMASQGKVGYIDDETAVWRRCVNTVSSPSTREKALKYIDHEVRQGLWLAKIYPKTPYGDFTLNEAEMHRNNSIWQLALSRKDYVLLRMVDFNLLNKPRPLYANNYLFFICYVYIIKKIRTVFKLLRSKI